MSILKIASNSNLPSIIIVRRPFTPIERVNRPRRQIIAIRRHRIRTIIRIRIGARQHGIRQRRVRPRSDIRQPQRRIRHVPLLSRRVLQRARRRVLRELRPTARRGRVRLVRLSIVPRRRAGSRVVVREVLVRAQRRREGVGWHRRLQRRHGGGAVRGEGRRPACSSSALERAGEVALVV